MARYRRYRSPFKLKLKKRTIANITGLVLITASGLLFLSFIVSTQVLFVYKSGFDSLFGWTTILFGLVGFLTGFTIIGTKWRIVQFNVVLGAGLVFTALAALTNIFSESASGSLGRMIWAGIASIFTGVGAALILLVAVLVGIIILFNTSLDQALSFITNSLNFLKKHSLDLFFKKKYQAGLIRNSTGSPKLRTEIGKVEPKMAIADEVKEISIGPVANLPTEGKIWQYPPLSLLSDKIAAKADQGDSKQNAQTIEKTLEGFGIRAKVAEVNFGPAVTQYALEIPLGTKISKITALQNDLALALATPTGTVRIEAPIPGKSFVGVEIPNRSLEVVSLKHILAAELMQKEKSKLAVALGLNVSGDAVIGDIGRMPHILMAGTTGSGKSVAINAFISSLLFRNSPNELKLVLVDPKRVELSDYNGIPHLLTPVIVDAEKIISALKWAMGEMDRRYKLFSDAGVRNITGYNELSGFQALPYIVIVVDELADLMAFAPAEVEDAIIRLAQMARATGLHLVIATQRPSVDVITGLIKANIPCRIAFNVSSMIDSRVILDQPGAEKLLGRGDMLYLPPDVSKPQRLQGVFVSDAEIRNLINFLKSSGVEPQYTEEVTEMVYARAGVRGVGAEDDLFEEAVRTICQYDRASASLLQRRLRVGYARAARLLDELEEAGIVGASEGSKPRDVLVRNAEEYLQARAGGGTQQTS